MFRATPARQLGRLAAGAVRAAPRRAAVPALAASQPALRAFSAAAALRQAQPATDFDPHAQTAMDKQQPPAPGEDFNVVIVGA